MSDWSVWRMVSYSVIVLISADSTRVVARELLWISLFSPWITSILTTIATSFISHGQRWGAWGKKLANNQRMDIFPYLFYPVIKIQTKSLWCCIKSVLALCLALWNFTVRVHSLAFCKDWRWLLRRFLSFLSAKLPPLLFSYSQIPVLQLAWTLTSVSLVCQHTPKNAHRYESRVMVVLALFLFCKGLKATVSIYMPIYMQDMCVCVCVLCIMPGRSPKHHKFYTFF